MSGAKATIYILLAFIGAVTIGVAALAFLGPRVGGDQEAGLLLTMLLLILTAPLAATLHRVTYRAGAFLLSFIFVVIWGFWIAGLTGMEDSWPWFTDEKLEQSVLILFFMGLPTAVALMCRGKPWATSFRRSLVWTAAISGLAALFIVWFFPDHGGPDDIKNRILTTCVWCALCGASASMLLINVGRRDRRYFRWPGILTALAALCCGVYTTWHGGEVFDLSTRTENASIHLTAITTFWIAVTLALVNAFLNTNRPGLVRIFKWLSVLFCLAAGSVMVALVKMEFGEAMHFPPPFPLLQRSLEALTFLFTGSAICMIVARSALRVQTRSNLHEGVSALELKCPNCGTLQTLGLNGACRHCLLRFNIQLTDPHCPACDHLLLNLESNRCPECGHDIRRPVAPAPEPSASPNSAPVAG